MKKHTYLIFIAAFLLCALFLASCDKKTTEPNQVATPEFNPAGGTYKEIQFVSISCATPHATIRYTTDGSDPGSSSSTFSSLIRVPKNTTIKARAFRAGWADSEIASAEYQISKVATPVFDPTGGTYNEAQEVSISCVTPDATIRYTTDGSNPDSLSSVYSSAITVSQNITLKARAFKEDWADSEIASAEYQITSANKVASPVIDPGGGIYSEAQNVSISCETPDAIIRYTTDGSSPDASSLEYSSPLMVSQNTTLKARAFKEDWADSDIASAYYVINPDPNRMIYVYGDTLFNGTTNVILSSFYIDKYETTQAEYQAVMGQNPSHFGGNPEHPVETVSWYNAIEYCNRRSMQEGLTPCYSYNGYGTNPEDWPNGWNESDSNHTKVKCEWKANGYRLPTEMEWMFAAMGGIESQDYSYSGSDDIDEVAWYHDNNSPNGTKPVGTKIPNELGIYDMSGNVWELCWDIFGPYSGTEQTEPQTNPYGAANGSRRVTRGGSWGYLAELCTVYYRLNFNATNRNNFLGFRVCRISL